MVDAAALMEGLQGVPLPYLVGAALALFAASMLVLRVFANALRGKSPPIDEGIPFVGGLIKFSKVRAAQEAGAGGAGAATARRRWGRVAAPRV